MNRLQLLFLVCLLMLVALLAGCSGGSNASPRLSGVPGATVHLLRDPKGDVRDKRVPDIRVLTVHASRRHLVIGVRVSGKMLHALKEPCCISQAPLPTVEKGLTVDFFDPKRHRIEFGAGGSTFDLKHYPGWKKNQPSNRATSVRINREWNSATFVFPLRTVPVTHQQVLISVSVAAGKGGKVLGYDYAPDRGFFRVKLG